MKKKSILMFLVLIAAGASLLVSGVDARLFQYPDVSDTHITFVYGGDIWIVSKNGGRAVKLSSPEGQEVLPKFSPDGKSIAFTGNYDGNEDIYSISVNGGDVRRLTYHRYNDRMLDWYPDGKSILFASPRYSGRLRFSQLYKMDKKGGLPEKLPVPYGEFGSVSEDGKILAYTKRTRLHRTWKRYRGGTATDIWLFNLKTCECENITNNSANDELPMWHNSKVYFLSDQGKNKRFNIWVYDRDTKKTKQVTAFKDFDVHFPSIGKKDMVFEAAGKLYLMNLGTEKYKEVNVEIVTDLARLKPVSKNVSSFPTWVDASPDAKRLVMQARGELFSIPAKHGFTKNISRDSGAADRYPAWSPDGKTIAFWSDRTGEYQLYIYDCKTGKISKLTSYKNGYNYRLFWSPDSSKLAFINQAMKITVFNIKSKQGRIIDQALWKMHGALRGFSCSWSADSRWLTYSRGLDNTHSAVFVWDTKLNRRHQLTSGYYSDTNPVFGADSKHIFYISKRKFRPVYSDMEGTWIYPNASRIMAAPLRAFTKSPLFARNDSVALKKAEKKSSTKKKNGKKAKKAPKLSVMIDINGFEGRAVILPVKAGNISNLNTASGKLFYHRRPNSGSLSKLAPIMVYDLKKRKEKKVVSDLSYYFLTHDKKNIIAVKKFSTYIIKAAPGQKLTKPVNTRKLRMRIDPAAEWAQILREAWRLERDMFYDPNMHGVDWPAVYKQYSGLLKYAVSREDVNFLIGEMIGEMNASHSYRGGGDVQRAKRLNVGYLGINWAKSDNFYKIKKIIRGAAWDSEVRSPLDAPGLKVKEGNYILAVNGIKIDTSKEPSAAFEGLAGETVELTLNSKPSYTGSWTIVVKTLRFEDRLRHLEWIEKKRARVDKATNGQIGYIYVRSTGIDGQNELVRQFYAQFHKKGLIIDERFNSGGQIPDRFIELLNRKPLAFWALRDGKTWQHPGAANYGPKVMLINGWSGSGGDAFPDYFRKAKLGPLVGTRTWGGLIGISGAPMLVDGGAVTVPTFRMYNPDGTWFKEGHGVEPDIKVVDDATQMAKGVDPQLEAAIKEVLRLLKKHVPAKKIDPPYEKR